MTKDQIQVYPYRWVVLFVFALICAIIQIQWLTFASVAREARLFYNVSALQIDFLSLIFMIIFLLVCIPASYIIDRFGIRMGLGIGAVLTGVFGLMKGFYPSDYTLVVIAQTGLAVAQPFIMNAATKVAVQWFPLLERALAVGISTLAQFLGIIIVMICTPLMIETGIVGVYDLSSMLMTYGLISGAGAVIMLVFLREKPPTPPEIVEYKEDLSILKNVKLIFGKPDMKYLFPVFFIGLGVFNAVSTCIDQICQTKGLTMEQTGLIGGIMLVGGIIGALILPVLSDKLKRRKAFLVIAMAGATPGIMGLTFFTNYPLLLTSSFLFGFFLLGAGAPVGFQYCAEITRPAPEAISQGLLLFTGQASGILFIIFMNSVGIKLSMIVFILFALINTVLSLCLKESKMILASRKIDVERM